MAQLMTILVLKTSITKKVIISPLDVVFSVVVCDQRYSTYGS